MYCPSCGTPNADGSKFCAKCGKPIPQSTPPAIAAQSIQPTAMQTAPVLAWRSVGIIALVGGGACILAFLMSWLTTPTLNLGGPTVVGQVTGWTLFRMPIDFLTSLANVRGSNLAGSVFAYLPGQVQLFILIYFIDSLMLILVPILGVIIAIRGWQITQASSYEAVARRQRSNRRLAIFGLVPPLGLLVLSLILVAALSSPYGQQTDLFSVLRLFDVGYWLTIGALLLIIFAGPLAAPKRR